MLPSGEAVGLRSPVLLLLLPMDNMCESKARTVRLDWAEGCHRLCIASQQYILLACRTLNREQFGQFLETW